MTTHIETMTHLCSIKGTAMNKARARVWLERKESDLSGFGFPRGERVDIELMGSSIVIRAAVGGARKVAGRPGKCIFDICFPAEQRAAMFGGAERLDVLISHGVIVIQAAKSIA